MSITARDLRRLENIKWKIEELIDEAKHIVKGAGGFAYERARSYWIPHIIIALSKEHDYLGGSMVTMADTIEELKDQVEDFAEDVEDDVEEEEWD